MQLAVVETERSGIPVLAFAGELDGMLIDEFDRNVIGTAQAASGCVIVDLEAVTYIDSQSFGGFSKRMWSWSARVEISR